MTTVDLARRAVAAKGWRWLPGMRAVEHAVPGMALSTRPMRVDDYWHEVGVWLPDWLPDLSDPATRGCILALVREAWNDPYLCVVGDPATGWRIDAVAAAVADLHSFASEMYLLLRWNHIRRHNVLAARYVYRYR